MQGVRFEPTEEQRRTVRAMSGFGIPQEDIATFLEIEPKTLRKHFRRELDRGMVEATAKVAQSLFQMATTGNNVAAAIFWMKARAGWREKQELRVGPTQMDQMTDAELERILQHLRDEIAEADEQAAEAAQLTDEQQPPST
ncbi:hypothetical protein [Elioraea rosea]|uniref:hypothetical protein n=1 Tax=Elioraea rosea TaxID=2492390 RepID=UPI001185DFB6|nr:hypothetical protein [Elioraea rosea]